MRKSEVRTEEWRGKMKEKVWAVERELRKIKSNVDLVGRDADDLHLGADPLYEGEESETSEETDGTEETDGAESEECEWEEELGNLRAEKVEAEQKKPEKEKSGSEYEEGSEIEKEN